MWPQVLIFVALALAAVFVLGRSRWNARTLSLRSALANARAPFDPAAWTSPPEPVRRYLRAVLPPDLPRILSATFTHTGTFLLGDQWRPFNSHQFVVTRRPGFLWDARISRAFYVHDAYIAGAGLLHATLFGLLDLAHTPNTPELAEGELQRFLAEAVWYPSLYAPGGDVRWDAMDDQNAAATLRDGKTSAALSFHFSDAGLVTRIFSPARFRIVDKKAVPTPWECRLWNYQRHAGILIPTEAEVAWLLPTGPLPYWRGRLTSIYFEFERTQS